MKRAIDDLNGEECAVVFQKLSDSDKRAALKSVFPGGQLVTVYLSPGQLRDILSIVVRFVDVQTWGRMHCACRLFNACIPPLPDLVRLEAIFSQPTTTKEEVKKWAADCKEARELCLRYFTACVRRLIRKAHFIHPSFYLGLALKRAERSDDGIYGMRLPFGRKRHAYHVLFPYGHIVTKDNMPMGNVFTQDWSHTLRVNPAGKLRFEGYTAMSKERKKRYNQQKAQLAFLPWM